MKQFYISIFFLLSFFCSSCAQETFPIQLTVLGFPNQEIYIAKISGDTYRITDTLKSDSHGKFECAFDTSYAIGMYSFLFPQFQKTEIEFIFNKEAISFKTQIGNIHSNLQIISSHENQLYYSFQNFYSIFSNDISLLEQTFDSYSDSEFKEKIRVEYAEKIIQEQTFIASLLKNHESTFAARIIKSSRKAYSPQLLNTQERYEYTKQHFLSPIDFSDTLLQNSSIFTDAAIQYLSLYAKERSRSNPYAALKQAVDTVLTFAKINETTYEFIVNYLLNGFETMGDTEMLTYISTLYISESQCEHSESKTTLERKALQNIHYTIGTNAPNYKAQTISGITINPEESKNTIQILIFWATWCGHCTELIPKIAKLFTQNPNAAYSLVFVSLDTEQTDFSSFLSQNPNLSHCNNVFDSNGWDSPLAKEFYVYASPTIFIIENGTIVAKPIDYEEYTNALLKLGVL